MGAEAKKVGDGSPCPWKESKPSSILASIPLGTISLSSSLGGASWTRV